MKQLKSGDKAPEFSGLTDDEKSLSLTSLRGQKVILYFYPKDDTSGCTKQACGFRDSHEELTGCNTVVLGVSPDPVKSHQKFKTKYELPFTLIVDQDHKIADSYGVWGEKSMYGRKYMGIIRSHFVIDEQGKIIDAQYDINPDESVTQAVRSVSHD